MTFLEIFIIIILIVSTIALIYISCISKLNIYHKKMEKADKIISENLEKKQEIIININTNIKKLTDKKEYLKEYIDLKDKKITNIERDFKLDEASKLINDLARDFGKLSKDTDFNKKAQNLREINEVLVSAKKIYNENAQLNNKLIKLFPYNIIAKINNYKTITFYNNEEYIN